MTVSVKSSFGRSPLYSDRGSTIGDLFRNTSMNANDRKYTMKEHDLRNEAAPEV